MKRKMIFIVVTLLNLVIFTNVFAQVIDKVVAFGDSLSDNGNVYHLTLEAQKMVPTSPIIPDDPYYHGRFSNGPVWVENIAQSLNVPLLDYAYGGAWAESFRDSHLLVPFDLRMQVNFFLVHAVRDYHKDQHLFTIWIGANDYLAGRKDLNYATTNTVNKIKTALTSLINYGAKYLLILNLPDLATLPIVKQRALTYGKQLTELAQMHNKKLAELISELKQNHPAVHFMLLDVGSIYAEVRRSTEQTDGSYNGVKNFSDACYNGGYYPGINFVADESLKTLKRTTQLNVDNSADLKIAMLTSRYAKSLRNKYTYCDNPDEYFYWDLVHPSKVIHAKLTEIVLKAIMDDVK